MEQSDIGELNRLSFAVAGFTSEFFYSPSLWRFQNYRYSSLKDALITFFEFGNVEFLQILYANGFPIKDCVFESKTYSGYGTPCHIASYFGHWLPIYFLSQLGVTINEKTQIVYRLRW
jgi:hypothetical protein